MISLLWSSVKANRYVLRPVTADPCRTSPVHSRLGASASNRPCTTPRGPAAISARTKCRCRVRSDGAQPRRAAMTRATCAAVRCGFSLFSAAASSSTAASVRGATCRGEGHSASNPPARYARIHRSRLVRDTRAGPACTCAAMPRTSPPRCRVVTPGSSAGAISR